MYNQIHFIRLILTEYCQKSMAIAASLRTVMYTVRAEIFFFPETITSTVY